MKKYGCQYRSVKWVFHNLAKLSTWCFKHSGDISCSLLVNPSHIDESWEGRNTCMWISIYLSISIYIYIYIYIFIYAVCTKSNQINASKNCLATFGSSACQSLSWHVQLLDLPHKCLTTRRINTNKCQRKWKSYE